MPSLAPTLKFFPLPDHPGYYFSNVSGRSDGLLSATLRSPEGEVLVSIVARFWTDQEGPQSGIYGIAQAFLTSGFKPKVGAEPRDA